MPTVQPTALRAHPDIPAELYAQAEARTTEAFEAVKAQNPWIESVPSKARAIAQENASQRSKFRKFVQLAGRINDAVAPHAQCVAGCSACCHISVSLTTMEAQTIGQAIGMAPARPAKVFLATELDDWETEKMRFFGTPCPFLEGNRCSIYANRPVARKTHANLGDAFFCSTEVPPEESAVSNLDLRGFYLMMTGVLLDSPVADIRDFFPCGLQNSRKEV